MVFTFPENANMYEESCFFFGSMNYHRKSSKLFYNNLFSTTPYQCQRAFQLRSEMTFNQKNRSAAETDFYHKNLRVRKNLCRY